MSSLGDKSAVIRSCTATATIVQYAWPKAPESAGHADEVGDGGGLGSADRPGLVNVQQGDRPSSRSGW